MKKDREEQDPYDDPYLLKGPHGPTETKKKDYKIIVGVCIILFLIILGIIYYVYTLPPEEYEYPPLEITLFDAPTTTAFFGNNFTFERGEPILIIRLDGDIPIVWEDFQVFIYIIGETKEYHMDYLEINGIPKERYFLTEPGDNVTIGLYTEKDNGEIYSGDQIGLKISNYEVILWESKDYIIVE